MKLCVAVVVLGALLDCTGALQTEGPLPEAYAASNATLLAHVRRGEKQKLENATAGTPAWTSTGPDSTEYNEETYVEHLPVSLEVFFAVIYCLLIASAPIVLAGLAEEQLTRAHMLESVALIIWLMTALFMFTNVLKFQSYHWEGTRPLTIVEAVYLLSQILTTVGYGDITPAFPRGQVWVGVNVIIALCLYGSIIMEVVGIVHQKVQKLIASNSAQVDGTQPLKAWMTEEHADRTTLVRSGIFFACMAAIGICFFHFYPGEEKTWLQAVYMSIITLSTVGFGAYTATTEAGKVFAAFWMLVGVAALGTLVTSFIEFMIREKAVERHTKESDVQEFQRILDACVDPEGPHRGRIDKLAFLKMGLMLSKGTKVEKLERIEKRFQKLAEGQQHIRRTTIVDKEGPTL